MQAYTEAQGASSVQKPVLGVLNVVQFLLNLTVCVQGRLHKSTGCFALLYYGRQDLCYITDYIMDERPFWRVDVGINESKTEAKVVSRAMQLLLTALVASSTFGLFIQISHNNGFLPVLPSRHLRVVVMALLCCSNAQVHVAVHVAVPSSHSICNSACTCLFVMLGLFLYGFFHTNHMNFFLKEAECVRKTT